MKIKKNIINFVLLFLVILPMIVPVSAGQEITNGSFESTISVWDFSTHAYRVDYNAYIGSYSALIVDLEHIHQTISVNVADFQLLTLWAFTGVVEENANPVGMLITLDYKDASGGALQDQFYFNPYNVYRQKTIQPSQIRSDAVEIIKINIYSNQPASIHVDWVSLTTQDISPPCTGSFCYDSVDW